MTIHKSRRSQLYTLYISSLRNSEIYASISRKPCEAMRMQKKVYNHSVLFMLFLVSYVLNDLQHKSIQKLLLFSPSCLASTG